MKMSTHTRGIKETMSQKWGKEEGKSEQLSHNKGRKKRNQTACEYLCKAFGEGIQEHMEIDNS